MRSDACDNGRAPGNTSRFEAQLGRLGTSQTPYHVKVFLSRDPLGVVRAKPQSLVQRLGRRIVHLDQEGNTIVSELAGSIAPRFDQLATVAFALAMRTHAEGIHVKLRRFRFSGDRIFGI